MEFQALILSLLILTLVSNTEQRSLETPLTCAVTCIEQANYELPEPIQYSYRGRVESSFQASPDRSAMTSMEISTTVQIIPRSRCEMEMHLEGTSLVSDEPSFDANMFIDSLERNLVRFSWQDGKIPSICAADNEPTWVLNIKKGILSTLQVSATETTTEVTETDVTGTCTSAYNVTGSESNKMISKAKNYNTCENRGEYLLFSFFTSYELDSPRQNFIHSEQNCHQTIDDAVVEGVECREKHVFRPFSSDESGAQTVITQILQRLPGSFDNWSPMSMSNTRRSTLEYENEEESAGNSRDLEEIEQFLAQLCDDMDGEEYVEVGKDFVKLVSLLRRLDASAILRVQELVGTSCSGKERAFAQMFQDALQWCGSEGCVVAAAQLISIKRREVKDDVARTWLKGMSLVTKPTPAMLSAVLDVVDSERIPELSYLIAGSMTYQLCNSMDRCMSERSVQRALNTFQTKLGSNCHTPSDEQKQEILLALRAIGNAGRTNAINILNQCLIEESNDMEIRVAAIQAFRRMDSTTDRSALTQLLRDRRQDSEIRINSYLSLMTAPTPDLIERLVELLNGDTEKQVASFIWSHLNGLLNSKDPLKAFIKPLISEVKFATPHDLDPRKYSKYYEATMHSESLNAGASIDSSIIWSPKSFVPRSADLGLSVNVFGQAVNLLEVGGRVEGVETLIQRATQPGGFLSNNPLSSFLGNGDDEEARDGEARRPRSADRQQVGRLQNEYQAELNLETEPNANWYFRLFGNELMYGNLRELRSRQEAMNVRSILDRLMQDGEYEYHGNTMFLNSQHKLPTGIGFPLSIAFNGSASVDVAVEGRMDMSGLFAPNPSMEIGGAFSPRATVVISGTMTVDAHVSKIGIATESTALTSTSLEGHATIERGQQLTMKLDTPYNRNTVFKFNHKLMKIRGDEAQSIGGESDENVVTRCSNDIVGHRFCVDKPRRMTVFPVDGPISLSAYTTKTDSSVMWYKLTANMAPENLPAVFESNLHLSNTIGPIADMIFNYDVPEKNFRLELTRGSETTFHLSGNLENTATRTTANIVYVLKDVRKTIQSVFNKEQDGNEKSWSVTNSIELPSKTITSTARATINPSQSASASLTIENLFDSPVQWRLALSNLSENNRARYRGEGHVAIPNLVNTNATFDLHYRPRSDDFNFQFYYRLNNFEQQSILFHHKRRSRSPNNWSLDQKLVVTALPVANHHGRLSYTLDDGSISSEVGFEYGRLVGRPNNPQRINARASLSYSQEQVRGGATVTFQQPESRVYSAQLEYQRDGSLLHTTVTSPQSEFELRVENGAGRDGLLDKTLQLRIPTQWGDIVIDDHLVESPANVYTATGEFRIGTAGGLGMSGSMILKNLPDSKNISIVIDGDNGNLLTASTALNRAANEIAFSNSIQSMFNRPIELNLSKGTTESDGKRFELLFKHGRRNKFSVLLKREEREASLEADFNDNNGNRQLEGVVTIDPETWRADALVTIATSNPDLTNPQNYKCVGEISFIEGRLYADVSLKTNDVERVGVTGRLNKRLEGNEEGTMALLQVRRRLPNEGGKRAQIEIQVIPAEEKFVVIVDQTFKVDSPRMARVTLQILPGGASVRLEVGSTSIFASTHMTANSELAFSLEHNGIQRLEELPRSLSGNLVWDISTTGQKRIALTSTDMISQTDFIEAVAEYRITRAGSTSLEATVHKNHELLANANFQANERSVQFSGVHQFESTPKQFRANATLVAQSPIQFESSLLFSLNDQTTEISLQAGQGRQWIELNYDSNFPCSAGNIQFRLNKIRNGFNTILEKDGAMLAKLKVTQEEGSRYTLLMRQSISGRRSLVPDEVSLSLALSETESTVSIGADLNRERFRSNLNVNWEEKTATVTVEQNMRKMIELGCYQQLSITATGNLRTIEETMWLASFNTSMTVNNEPYHFNFAQSLKYDDSPMQLNTTVSHNIPALLEYDIPEEMSWNTSIVYELSFLTMAEVTSRVTGRNQGDDSDSLDKAVSLSFSLHLLQKTLSLGMSSNLGWNIPNLLELDTAVINNEERKRLRFNIRYNDIRREGTIGYYWMEQHEAKVWFEHDLAELYEYGIPKEFSIKLEKEDGWNLKAEVVCDRDEKTASFNFDYHTESGVNQQLEVMFIHPFDLVVTNLGIPKRLGFEIDVRLENNFHVKLITYNGPLERKAHVDITLTAESFHYSQFQDFVKRSVFPKKVRFNADYLGSFRDGGEATLRLMLDRKTVLSYNGDLARAPFSADMKLQQTVIKRIPKVYKLEVVKPPGNSFKLDLNVGNRKIKFLTKGNYSWSNKSFDIDFKLHGASPSPINLNVEGKWNIPENRVTFGLQHSLNKWKKYVPKKVKASFDYSLALHETMQNGEVGATLAVDWRGAKQASLNALYSRQDGALFGSVNLNHNFTDYQQLVPLIFSASGSGEVGESSIGLQANFTINELSYSHTVEFTYNLEESGFSAGFDATLDSAYLSSEGIPTSIRSTIALDWEAAFTVAFSTIYDDDSISARLSFDQEAARASFGVSHPWELAFNELNVVLTLDQEEREVSALVTIDGVERTARISGDIQQQRAWFNMHHDFPQLSISTLSMTGSYSLSPIYRASVNLVVNENSYPVEVSFEKLENGGRVTLLLPDDILRSAAFTNQMGPGQLSVEFNHNIPEIEAYIPRSSTVGMSMRREPQLNVTATLQTDSEEQAFSTELDVERMEIKLTNDFDLLLLPRSLAIRLFLPSESSPSYRATVTVNDVERLEASVSPDQMTAGFQQTLPLLQDLPESAGVQLAINPEEMSGSMTVTVEEEERRIGGSLNREAGSVNFYQTIVMEDVPRNITLSISGSLAELTGSVTLVIDEVERSVDALVIPNSRRLFSSVNIRVLELQSLMPEQVTVSADFDRTSGQLAFSFFKNNRNQTLSASINVQDSIEFALEQSIDLLRDLPASFAVELSGNIEEKRASIDFRWNGIYTLSVNGRVLINSDSWYGLDVTGTHNSQRFLNEFGIARNTQLWLGGKYVDSTLNGKIILNLIEDRFCSFAVEITPTSTEEEKAIAASYEHDYEGRVRNVSASVTLIRRNNRISIVANGAQTLPESRTISIILNSNAVYAEETMRLNADWTIRHGIEELEEYNVPTSTTGDFSAVWKNGIQHCEGAELFCIAGNAVVTAVVNGNHEYSLREEWGISEIRQNVGYHYTQTNGQETEREDVVALTSSIETRQVSVHAELNQRELNEYGVPQELELVASWAGVGLNKHWQFNFTVEGVPAVVTIDLVASKEPLSWDVTTAFDTSAALSAAIGIPHHVLVKSTAGIASYSDGYSFNETFALEYDDQRLGYDIEQNVRKTNGRGSRSVSTNIEELCQMFTFCQLSEDWTYSVNGKDLTANGIVIRNQVLAGNYSLDFDTQTGQFSFHSETDNGDYHISYKNKYLDNDKLFYLSVENGTDTILLINVEYKKASLKTELVNHLWLQEFDIDGSVSLKGLPFRASVDVKEVKKIEIFAEEYGKEQLNGYKLKVKVDKKPVTVKIAFSDSYVSGMMDVSDKVFKVANGKFEYAPTGAAIKYQNKKLSYEFDQETVRGRSSLTQTVVHRNIEYLESLGVPERTSSKFTHSAGELSLVVTARDTMVDLVDFRANLTSVNVTVQTPSRDVVLATDASYETHPAKSVSVSVKNTLYIPVDFSFTAKLQMFEASTGNSELDIALLENLSEKRFVLNAYAKPDANYDPGDILARFQAASTFDLANFNIDLNMSSNSADENWRYNIKLNSNFDEETLQALFNCAAGSCLLNVNQSWCTRAPAVFLTYEKNRDRENYENSEITLSWNELPADKIILSSKTKKLTASSFYGMKLVQPFTSWFVTDFEGSVFFSHANRYQLDINTNVNGHMNGMNATYDGQLPRLVGRHKLVVDIDQSPLSFIPNQFTTTGVVTISESEYNSNWLIESGARDLVIFNKRLAKNARQMEMSFLWKQFLFNSAPFHHVAANCICEDGSGKMSLQVDNMKNISIQYQVENDAERGNQSYSVDFSSGPMAELLKFDTFSFSQWRQNSRKRPGFKIGFNVDDIAFEVKGSSLKSRRSSRVLGSVSISHKRNLNLLGKTIPQRMVMGYSVLERATKSIKTTVTFDSDALEYPLMIKASSKSVRNGNTIWILETTYKPNGGRCSNAQCENMFDYELSVNYLHNPVTLGVTFSNITSEVWSASLSYDETTHILEIHLNGLKEREIVLRSELTQFIQLAEHFMNEVSGTATTSFRLIHGVTRTANLYDMYIGFTNEGNSEHTLHLILSSTVDGSSAAIQIKRDDQLVTEAAKVAVKLIEGRMLQLKFAADPRLVDFFENFIEVTSVEATNKINEIADIIIENLLSAKTLVLVNDDELTATYSAQIDEVIAYVNRCRARALDLVNRIADRGNRKIRSARSATEDEVRNSIKELLEKVDSVKASLLQPFTDVYARYTSPIVTPAKAFLLEKLNPLVVQLRKINAGVLLIELVEEAVEKTFTYAMTNGQEIFDIVNRPLADMLYVDNANVIFNIPLVVDVSQLQSPPTFEDVKTWLIRSAFATAVNSGIENIYSYADDYYRVRALVYIPRDEILPPFKGHAFVSRFRHFSTFDKRHFNFSSSTGSSHILTTDMKDKNFTVAISYSDSDSLPNAIEVIVGNRHVIVYENYEVYMHGRAKRLPLIMDKMSVVLEGTVLHVRRTEGDLDVACDFSKHLCTVDISPYYFGWTAGLLGVYNNEPSDDFVRPDHEFADTSEELALAWKLDSSNPTNNFDDTNTNVYSECSALFDNNDSPLRACFPLVDRMPFMAMCNDDMAKLEDSCSAVHAYAYRCGVVGALVRMPASCVQCQARQGRGRSDETFDSSMSLNSQINELDLVVVVEQGSCIGENPSIKLRLKKLLKALERSASAERVRGGIRHRLVTFGGPGASSAPSTVTIDRKHFSYKGKSVVKAVGALRPNQGAANADHLSAIRYATQLPFKAGAKPMIVLLTCESCQESQDTTFSDVAWQLRKQGITLHHFPARNIRATKRKTVFGYDNVNAISKTGMLRRNVVKMNKEDVCAPLAVQTGGSIWNGLKMNNGVFASKAGNYLAGRIESRTRQICNCVVNDSGVATSICRNA